MPAHKGGKKGRKLGRDRKKCAAYAARHQRTKNNPLRKPHYGPNWAGDEEKTRH